MNNPDEKVLKLLISERIPNISHEEIVEEIYKLREGLHDAKTAGRDALIVLQQSKENIDAIFSTYGGTVPYGMSGNLAKAQQGVILAMNKLKGIEE